MVEWVLSYQEVESMLSVVRAVLVDVAAAVVVVDSSRKKYRQ